MEAFLKLPYEILVPNTLFEDELVKFTDEQKKMLLRGGLKVVDLPGEIVLRAQEIAHNMPHLSIHDGFAFALAESCPGCILLTGDGRLRKLASTHEMDVHGVLWVIDEIHSSGLATTEELLSVLQGFASDQSVRLPSRALATYIKRFESEEVNGGVMEVEKC